jgi:hypothetical protein
MMIGRTSKSISIGILLIGLVTICYSQSIDEMMRGPILGYTYVPDVGKFDISVQFISFNFNSSFDEDGKEVSFNDEFDGFADPELSQTSIQFSGDYRINNEFGISVSAPFISSQTIEWNPASGYEEYFEDASGETGLGDMTISAWYQLVKDEKSSIQCAVGYELATGSSPDDASESSVSSTGSGHTAIKVGIGADIVMTPAVLLSALGHYTLNQEGAFSTDGYSWDEKQGNSILISGRAKMLASPQLSFGADFDFYSSGEDEIDGDTIDDSNAQAISITPMIGYKLSSEGSTVNITGGYILNISGVNYPKMNGFLVGVTAFF